KLIQKYGSVEGLIAHSHELKGKQRENVETFAEQGLLSKKLATIRLDVPIPLDEAELELQEPDRDLLEPLFVELEFRTFGRRVFGEEFRAVPTSSISSAGQMDLFSSGVAANDSSIATATNKSTAESLSDSLELRASRSVANVPHAYHLVQTEAEIRELL